MDAMEVGMGIGTGVWVSSITSMSISGDGAVIVVPIGCSNSYGGNSRGGNHGGNFMDRSDGKRNLSSLVGIEDLHESSGSFSNFRFFSQIGSSDGSRSKSSMFTSLGSGKSLGKFGLCGFHLFGVFKGTH